MEDSIKHSHVRTKKEPGKKRGGGGIVFKLKKKKPETEHWSQGITLETQENQWGLRK